MSRELVPSVFTRLYQKGDFGYMIQKDEYSDALFIFNENVVDFQRKTRHSGAGNAAIRPYRYVSPKRAVGIPTGHLGRGGFTSLTPENKAIIDQALAEVREAVQKYDYERIFYSAEENGRLGTNLFQVGEDVKEYIVRELHRICE